MLLHPLQAEKTTRKAELADRLVNGLSGENKRWSETIKKMDAACGKLVSAGLTGGAAVLCTVCTVGNSLLPTCCTAYSLLPTCCTACCNLPPLLRALLLDVQVR